MKKILFLAAIVTIASGLKAQESRSNALKLNPLSLIFSTGNVAYEKAISSSTTAQLGAFYSGVSLGGIKYSGWGVTPEVRFYFGGKAMNGGYVAPFARYQNFTLKDKSTDPVETESFTSIGGGALLGWEKTWHSGFVLDLFAGPSYNSGKFKSSDGNPEFDIKGGINGFGVRTGITLGFAF
jgi:hypothetical protein